MFLNSTTITTTLGHSPGLDCTAPATGFLIPSGNRCPFQMDSYVLLMGKNGKTVSILTILIKKKHN